jgi:hypothetical protein
MRRFLYSFLIFGLVSTSLPIVPSVVSPAMAQDEEEEQEESGPR